MPGTLYLSRSGAQLMALDFMERDADLMSASTGWDGGRHHGRQIARTHLRSERNELVYREPEDRPHRLPLAHPQAVANSSTLAPRSCTYLAATGYEGVASLKCHGTHDWPLEYVTQQLTASATYVRACMPKAG